MGDFHKFYSGQSVAPYLTIFCGGNHEASNYMFELYYGGWAAPNIYYLGAANVVRFGPLRISAMSGIWKGYDFRKPHFERLPYNSDDLHSVYHVRELDIRKLMQIRNPVDIGLSHDWPRGIEYSGDHRELFRKKRGFKEDSEHGHLGNVAARDVLDRLRPAYWFSAHLHVKFAAALAHDGATFAKIAFPADQPAVWAVEARTPIPSPKAPAPAPATAPASQPAPKEYNIPMVSNVVRRASGTAESNLNAWNNFASGGALEFERQEREAMLQRMANKSKSESKQEDSVKAKGDQPAPGINQDEIDLDSGNESSGTGSGNPSPVKAPKLSIPSSDGVWDSEVTAEEPLVDRALTEGIRDKLPASFARPQSSGQSVRNKTVPTAITNKLTRFLALDKPHNRDPFMHLMKITPIQSTAADVFSAPFCLEYDKEWLAITRVFADELTLGDATAKVPADKGEEYYKARILEEEAWVEENLVKTWNMLIPHNFQPSAPNFDPEVSLTTTDQPPEYTNSQTTEFCKLIGIPNKFDLPESERTARMDAGPLPSRAGNGGHGRGGRGGPRRGRGGRGGAGRGVGRGAGRGHW